MACLPEVMRVCCWAHFAYDGYVVLREWHIKRNVFIATLFLLLIVQPHIDVPAVRAAFCLCRVGVDASIVLSFQ